MVKIMEKNRRTQTIRLRAFLVTGIVTVAALVAMIGVYQNINKAETEQTQLVQEQTQDQMEVASAGNETENDGTSGAEYEDYNYTASVGTDQSGLSQSEMASLGQDGLTDSQMTEAAESGLDTGAAEAAKTVDASSETQAVFSQKSSGFGKGSTIAWPVEGNVLMNYSMDKTVYFATLDQYKYNPAIIIQADVNTKVLAGTAGTIEEIDTNENTGMTVMVDLGNGYKATYGQLKEVKKNVGDAVTADTILGYIAEPTKYYSVEGSNLYFAMTKDDQPVNPMEFLK